ncbi:hypothetical protein ACVOMV_12475 [Mesorhizobium atlanticum]
MAFCGLALRLDVGDLGPRRHHAGFRLFEGGLIIAVVDAQKHRSGLDRLIVGDGDIGDAPGNFRANRYRACVDEGVVGPFIVACVEPPDDDGRDHQQNEDGDDRGYVGVASDEARLIGVGRTVIRLRVLHAPIVRALVCHPFFVAGRAPIGPGLSPRSLGGSGFALFSFSFGVQGNGFQISSAPLAAGSTGGFRKGSCPRMEVRAVSPPSSRHPPSG